MNITAQRTNDENVIELTINNFHFVVNNDKNTFTFDICQHIIDQQNIIGSLRMQLAEEKSRCCRPEGSIQGGMGAHK